MGCLGTDADPTYVPFLRDKLVEAIAAAQANLEPRALASPRQNAARIHGPAPMDPPARSHRGGSRSATRRVRANMHAGRNWDDVTGEVGPGGSRSVADLGPGAATAARSPCWRISPCTTFGDKDISADYFGLFCEGLKQRIAAGTAGQPAFVGIMSHGCSGDIWRRDYTKPASWTGRSRPSRNTRRDCSTSRWRPTRRSSTRRRRPGDGRGAG